MERIFKLIIEKVKQDPIFEKDIDTPPLNIIDKQEIEKENLEKKTIRLYKNTGILAFILPILILSTKNIILLVTQFK